MLCMHPNAAKIMKHCSPSLLLIVLQDGLKKKNQEKIFLLIIFSHH